MFVCGDCLSRFGISKTKHPTKVWFQLVKQCETDILSEFHIGSNVKLGSNAAAITSHSR